jgi:hypothetical protein
MFKLIKLYSVEQFFKGLRNLICLSNTATRMVLEVTMPAAAPFKRHLCFVLQRH